MADAYPMLSLPGTQSHVSLRLLRVQKCGRLVSAMAKPIRKSYADFH
jgi:hypothetical protein